MKESPIDTESPKPTFAIIGSGAVGCYYGALLQRAGYQIHFWARGAYPQLKLKGLSVQSCNGDFYLPELSVFRDLSALPACNYALISLKTTANRQIAPQLPDWIRDCGIISLQNGLGIEEEWETLTANTKVAAGLCFLCCNRISHCEINHLDYGAIRLAGKTEEEDWLKPVEYALSQAGVSVAMDKDRITARWRKLVWNIPFNGLCALTGKSTNEILIDPILRHKAQRLMEETIAIAKADGARLPKDLIEKMIVDTVKMRPYKPSMQLDREAKRPMELDTIYARPLEKAKTYNLSCPEMQSLWADLNQYQVEL